MPTTKETLTYLFTGKTPDSYRERIEEQLEEMEANEPRTYVGNTGVIGPKARFDATAEQQAAANAFWDVWRGEHTDEEFDAAWEALEKAFEGNEKEFDRLDSWLDKLMENMNSAQNDKDYNAEDWYDLPATWWKNPAGTTDENGITAADLQGFRGLPAGVMTAVLKGTQQGISGIRVQLDGRAVGELVAPYVSQEIAKDIG